MIKHIKIRLTCSIGKLEELFNSIVNSVESAKELFLTQEGQLMDNKLYANVRAAIGYVWETKQAFLEDDYLIKKSETTN